MATPAQPRIVIDNSFGAVFTAVVVCAALWGVSCVQTWYYFNRYPKDLWYIKLLVVATMIFDTIHQSLITHTIYFYLVTSYANPLAMVNMVWSIDVEVLFNGLIDLLVQGFLTYRVYLLSFKNWKLTGALASMVLGLFAVQLAYTVLSLKLVSFAALHRIDRLSMSINTMGAILDVILTITLCYLLHKSRTGFKRTDTRISRIMLFTVNTGLMTSICATVSLINFLVFPNALIYVAFYFLGGRLYTNSLLATLNSRQVVCAPEDCTWDSLGPMSGTAQSPGGSSAQNLSVKIDTTYKECIARTELTGI